MLAMKPDITGLWWRICGLLLTPGMQSMQKINPVALSRQKLPSSIAQYRALHEEVITGDTPYAQIAIEYEIEALSLCGTGQRCWLPHAPPMRLAGPLFYESISRSTAPTPSLIENRLQSCFLGIPNA